MSAGGVAQALLGALLRRFGARHVDLVGALGDLREDRDAIGQDFGEAERNRAGSASRCPGRYQSSPGRSVASSGVWPGSTPK